MSPSLSWRGPITSVIRSYFLSSFPSDVREGPHFHCHPLSSFILVPKRYEGGTLPCQALNSFILIVKGCEGGAPFQLSYCLLPCPRPRAMCRRDPFSPVILSSPLSSSLLLYSHPPSDVLEGPHLPCHPLFSTHFHCHTLFSPILAPKRCTGGTPSSLSSSLLLYPPTQAMYWRDPIFLFFLFLLSSSPSDVKEGPHLHCHPSSSLSSSRPMPLLRVKITVA